MANLLWGKVYYKEEFIGTIQEDLGGKTLFTYDANYIRAGGSHIAYSLPLQEGPHVSSDGLHPFFDNLVAEGWLENAQARLLGKKNISRFELLLAFGNDLAGAVSIRDPEPQNLSDRLIDLNDAKNIAVYRSKASLSGVQPKLSAIEKNDLLYPAAANEISTHIIKFPSQDHKDLVVNEYLSTIAFSNLLPREKVVDLKIANVQGIEGEVLAIKRFDRNLNEMSGEIERVHFEEFNQLLSIKSQYKYEGAYKDMSDFIRENRQCLDAEIYNLYLRILAGILIGNSDMHLKNFAMFHTDGGYRLTPSYDQVAASLYQYKTMALTMNNSKDLDMLQLKPSNIIKLGEEFGLTHAVINMAVKNLAGTIEAAKQAVSEAGEGTEMLKNKIIKMIEKRWNKTFSLIGKKLSK